MDRDRLLVAVTEVVADLADVPVEQVSAQARFDDLDVDSITKVELLVRLRAMLGMRIPDDTIADLAHVMDVVDLLAGLPAGTSH